MVKDTMQWLAATVRLLQKRVAQLEAAQKGNLISACVQSKQPERSLEIDEEKQKHGAVTNSSTCSTLISTCESSDLAVQAALGSGETSTPLQTCPSRDWGFSGDQAVLGSGETSTPLQSCPARDWDCTADVVLPLHRDEPNQPESALEVLEAMQRQGVHPDLPTYNTLISECANSKQPGNVFEVYMRMRNEGVLPDSNTYSSLISACVKDEQCDVAFELFDQMQQLGLEPDSHTYNIIDKACGICSQQERSEGTLETAFDVKTAAEIKTEEEPVMHNWVGNKDVRAAYKEVQFEAHPGFPYLAWSDVERLRMVSTRHNDLIALSEKPPDSDP